MSRAGFILELKNQLLPISCFPPSISPPPPTMAAVKRKLLLNTISVDIGCSSCRKPKSIISQIFRPKPKSPTPYSDRRLFRSPSSSSEKKLTDADMTYAPEVVGGGFWKIGGVSVAVEKDSNDPYVDFRQSMLQMILENEIYTQEGLRELLSCFLHLNSPCNHGIIIRAFAEIWDGVFCGRSGVPTAAPAKQRRPVRSRAF
ncbi:unnamed protein product [Citrullus colocynthis]|uniref:Transcription repressor n=1 Tax=Citrullus colocynthis TaxID=252529 RepID=A0ABP0YX38_9ROSI